VLYKTSPQYNGNACSCKSKVTLEFVHHSPPKNTFTNAFAL